MLRIVVFTLMLGCGLAVVSGGGSGSTHAAQDEAAGCAGSWLVQITLEGRDVPEDALIRFDPDGTMTVSSPPVLPAMPGPGEEPLHASAGLGTWESSGEGACAFEVVRLLGSDDGVGVGTLNIRGTAARNDSGDGLDGSLTYIRGTGFGQTASTSDGTFTGFPLDG